jgi:hypothetical protein
VPIVPGSVGFHFVSAVVADDPAAERGQALWITGTVDPELSGGPHGRTRVFTWVSRSPRDWDLPELFLGSKKYLQPSKTYCCKSLWKVCLGPR